MFFPNEAAEKKNSIEASSNDERRRDSVAELPVASCRQRCQLPFADKDAARQRCGSPVVDRDTGYHGFR